MNPAVLTPLIFAGVSLLAAVLNLIFIGRALGNYRALVATRTTDATLHRISRGFIFVWAFILGADLIRFAVGIALLDHIGSSLYLLLFEPVGSLLVAIVGLRSFR